MMYLQDRKKMNFSSQNYQPVHTLSHNDEESNNMSNSNMNDGAGAFSNQLNSQNPLQNQQSDQI